MEAATEFRFFLAELACVPPVHRVEQAHLDPRRDGGPHPGQALPGHWDQRQDGGGAAERPQWKPPLPAVEEGLPGGLEVRKSVFFLFPIIIQIQTLYF